MSWSRRKPVDAHASPSTSSTSVATSASRTADAIAARAQVMRWPGSSFERSASIATAKSRLAGVHGRAFGHVAARARRRPGRGPRRASRRPARPARTRSTASRKSVDPAAARRGPCPRAPTRSAGAGAGRRCRRSARQGERHARRRRGPRARSRGRRGSGRRRAVRAARSPPGPRTRSLVDPGGQLHRDGRSRRRRAATSPIVMRVRPQRRVRAGARCSQRHASRSRPSRSAPSAAPMVLSDGVPSHALAQSSRGSPAASAQRSEEIGQRRVAPGVALGSRCAARRGSRRARCVATSCLSTDAPFS